MDSFLGGRPPAMQAGLAFRVECVDPTSKLYNASLVRGGLGGMMPRGERFIGGSFALTSGVHLAGARVYTNLLSFWGTWEKAMQWRDWMLHEGARDVVVVVVWLSGLPGVYGAQDLAKWLERRRGSGLGRRPLEHHQDGLVVLGGIAAAERRVLACIYGDGPYVPDNDLVSPVPGVRLPVGATMVCPDPGAAMTRLKAWFEEGGAVSGTADASLLIIGMALEACRQRS